MAGRFIMDYNAGTLVHGIVRNEEQGDIAHAWVEIPDGFIYEPTTDSVYHPEDFERLHRPIVLAKYPTEETFLTLARNKHWGPWDDASNRWYATYHAKNFGLNHREASQAATEAVTESK